MYVQLCAMHADSDSGIVLILCAFLLGRGAHVFQVKSLWQLGLQLLRARLQVPWLGTAGRAQNVEDAIVFALATSIDSDRRGETVSTPLIKVRVPTRAAH